MKPDIFFLVKKLENLNALLSDAKTDNKKEVTLVGIPNTHSVEYVYIMTFRPCDEIPGYFVIDKGKIPTDPKLNSRKSSTSVPIPMALWDTRLNMMLDQGLTYADSTIADFSANDFRPSLRNKAVSNRNQIVDAVRKYFNNTDGKDDFDATFADASDILYNIARDAKSDLSINAEEVDWTLRKITRDILGKQHTHILVTEENRYRIGKNFISILDAMQQIISQYGRNQDRQFNDDSSKYTRTLTSVLGIVINIIKDNFSRYTQMVYELFPDGVFMSGVSVTKIKKQLLDNIVKCKKLVNEIILNPSVELTSNNKEVAEKELEDSISRYKNYISEQTPRVSADSVKEKLQKADVKLYKADDDLVQFVENDIMHNNVYNVKKYRVWKVVNAVTEAAYNKTLKADGDNANEHMLWHGSANNNWESIITKGLSMEYAGNGMYGKGIYFADKSKKSFGYTSGRGSKWAGGTANRLYLAVFKVNLGRTYTTQSAGKFRNTEQYDSVTALGGRALRMNEYVIYDDSRCTIRGLVEIYI